MSAPAQPVDGSPASNAPPQPHPMYPPPGQQPAYPPPPGLAPPQPYGHPMQPVYGQPLAYGAPGAYGGAYAPQYQVYAPPPDVPANKWKGCLASGLCGAIGCLGVSCLCGTPYAWMGAALGCVLHSLMMIGLNATVLAIILSGDVRCWLGRVHSPNDSICNSKPCDADGCAPDFALNDGMCEEYNTWSCVGVGFAYNPMWGASASWFKWQPCLVIAMYVLAIFMSWKKYVDYKRIAMEREAGDSGNGNAVPLVHGSA
eukprot:TRINITY_DN3956_c0_g2_i3.p1 TRINITY_DN3956_c0_g2~~TRINITY_DN3956_c0_g2_i3.p1  ORF type:complete len:257 (+),score=29.96 TRINITY_DN3956_c0_g2_i3:59-829(+)